MLPVQRIPTPEGTESHNGGMTKAASRCLWARCIEQRLVLQNLVACLQTLLDDIGRAKVCLAFEFEPSALCALGSLDTVHRFCDELDNLQPKHAGWKHIGFNLDIAHWGFLARHQPEDLPTPVKRRIVHSHVSSHSRGHLADAPA